MSKQIKNALAFWGAVVFMMAVTLCTAIEKAEAGGYHKTINNYYITEATEEHGDSGRAASMSQAQCHFDMSTKSNQGCVGAGYDFNTDNSAVSFGVGKRLGQKKVLINGMLTLENHRKAAIGAGVNFHF